MYSMHLPEQSLLQGGKYRIIRFIGQGGFGCTYEAEMSILRKRVAIKEFFICDFCNREANGDVKIASVAKTIVR